MSGKEAQEKLVAIMREWQRAENASIVSTARILEKTTNPLVRLVMEIIQRDSQRHYQVQQMIIDSLEKQAFSLSPDDLGAVWDQIEEHIQLEEGAHHLAEDSLNAIQGRGMILQSYLLQFLMDDEVKHDNMLERLEAIKKGMYPYASS